MNYGIPYKGSKNKIAENIIAQLPSAKHFYDLFGGGGAITHCALLSGKYQYIHYNEFNPLVFKAFKMAINGEFEGENRWISREDFERLKDSDPYVAICFSFGNNLKNYAYNKECEKFKKAVHYSIFFNDNSLLKEYAEMSYFKYSSENLKERRLELQSYLMKLLREKKLNIDYGLSKSSILQTQNKLEKCKSIFNNIKNVRNVTLNYTNLSYEQIPIEENSVIYCDPPYINTSGYLDDFDHEKFYEWLRKCREKNQQVFISEYQMPNDFYEIFLIKTWVSFSQKQNTQKLEKLFVNMGYESVYTQMNLF